MQTLMPILGASTPVGQFFGTVWFIGFLPVFIMGAHERFWMVLIMPFGFLITILMNFWD